MNVKAAIAALKPLEGHHIILANTKPRGFVHAQHCITIDHLPPDQRQTHNQGNIILWDGHFTSEGLQAGATFWAKNVRTITWSHDHITAHIYGRNGTISITKQWKLDEQGEDQ